MHDEADKQWVARCLDGHPDDYRHLVCRYEAMVRAYLGGRLRQRAEAEDATQETFVRAYLALNRLREPYSFPSWLMGVAANVAKERWRKNPREVLMAHADLEAAGGVAECSNIEEGDVTLQRSIAELADPYREVILLRYYAGLSCAEMAARLGKPMGTVTKTLSRAYEILRLALERDVSNR